MKALALAQQHWPSRGSRQWRNSNANSAMTQLRMAEALAESHGESDGTSWR